MRLFLLHLISYFQTLVNYTPVSLLNLFYYLNYNTYRTEDIYICVYIYIYTHNKVNKPKVIICVITAQIKKFFNTQKPNSCPLNLP